MTEEELGKRVRDQFVELIQTGIRDGGAAMHEAVEKLPEAECRLLLSTALGYEIARARKIAASTTN